MRCSHIITGTQKQCVRKAEGDFCYQHESKLPLDIESIIASYLTYEDMEYLYSLDEKVLIQAAKSRIGNIPMNKKDALFVLTHENLSFMDAVLAEASGIIRYLAPFQDRKTFLKGLKYIVGVTDKVDLLRYLLSLAKDVNERALLEIAVTSSGPMTEFFLKERKVEPYEGLYRKALSDSDNWEVIQIFLKNGIDPERDSVDFYNPLADAIGSGYFKSAYLLLKEVNLDNFGEEALDSALAGERETSDEKKKKQYMKLIKILLKNVEPTSWMLEKTTDEKIRRMLIKAGAPLPTPPSSQKHDAVRYSPIRR